MNLFLLHGGGTGLYNWNNFAFWREMADFFRQKKSLGVLAVSYALPIYDEKLELDEVHEGIKNRLDDNVINDLQWANPHQKFYLTERIEHANIIYVMGGDGDLLQENIVKRWPNFHELLDGKVLAGESAGANMWATKYYSNDNQATMDGLGILPIKTFCHWDSSKCDKLNQLINDGENLPVYPLTESNYVSIRA